jgi:glycosyltransferase involved in cell wall biosynthesis
VRALLTATTLPAEQVQAAKAELVSLSVVIPVMDEAGSLPQLLEEIQASVANLSLDGACEIIFIDDGSTDGSTQVIEELVRRHAGVQLIQFRRNFGKSAALAAGFAVARGEYVVTLDADLQDVPAEMGRLLAPLQSDEADLVSGWKTPRQDPWSKTVPSAVFNRTLRLLTGISLHDFNCGFKAYRHEVLDELRLYGEMHRYIPVLAHFRGFRLAEVPVRHRHRQHGRSKFGIERTFRGFFDLLTVMFLNHYTRRPLHLFGWLGGLALAAGFAVNAYLAILKLGFGEPIGHRPLLTLGVLLMVIGGQFVVFGLLGEMIAYQTRVSIETNDRRLPRTAPASGYPGHPIDYSIRRIVRHEPPDARND